MDPIAMLICTICFTALLLIEMYKGEWGWPMGKLTNKRSKPDICIDSTNCNIELQNKYGQVGYAILVRAVLDYTELLQLEYFNINIEDMKYSKIRRLKQKYEDMMSAKDYLYNNLWTYNLDFDRLTRMLKELIYQYDGHLLENYKRFYIKEK